MQWTITIAVFILILLLLWYLSGQLSRKYLYEVKKGLKLTGKEMASLLTEDDILHLPKPVQNYLIYTKVVGRDKVYSYRATFGGTMKSDKNKDWMDVTVKQYSFVDNLTRLFFIKAKMLGLPVVGLHFCRDAIAQMVIKVAGLITVVNGRGEEMNKAETVTVLNDMCLLAPATLIDERIQWQQVDALTVKATFRNKGYTISALLHFNDDGRLINFESDDRYYSPSGNTFESAKWSTPITEYKERNGFLLPSYAEAVWSFPKEDFTYIRFHIQDIEYNVVK